MLQDSRVYIGRGDIMCCKAGCKVYIGRGDIVLQGWLQGLHWPRWHNVLQGWLQGLHWLRWHCAARLAARFTLAEVTLCCKAGCKVYIGRGDIVLQGWLQGLHWLRWHNVLQGWLQGLHWPRWHCAARFTLAEVTLCCKAGCKVYIGRGDIVLQGWLQFTLYSD